MRSEGNDPKNREPTADFSFTTMLRSPVGFGQGFLSREQCDNTGASPYSLDLAPGDFYMFRRLKSALKERRLCDVTDINTNATEELKKLSLNGFRNVSNNFTVAGRRL
jgi:hypothetical protein